MSVGSCYAGGNVNVVGGLVDVSCFRRSSSVETRDESCSDSGVLSHDEEVVTGSDGGSFPRKSGSHEPRYGGSGRQRHHGDPEKRMRREIANSNERRRMQSINAGFQSLKNLVRPRNGDKLSKAAILQHAVDYIGDLHRQRAQLQAKNARLTQLLAAATGVRQFVDETVDRAAASPPPSAPIARRRRREASSSSDDEGPRSRRPAIGPAPTTHQATVAAAVVVQSAAAAAVVDGTVVDPPRRLPAVDELMGVARRASRPDVIVPVVTSSSVMTSSSPAGGDPSALVKLETASSAAAATRMPSGAGTVVTCCVQSTTPDTRPTRDAVLDPARSIVPATLGSWNFDSRLLYASGLSSAWQPSGAPLSSSSGAETLFSSTSRRNLDTILEAIRHLEGGEPCLQDADDGRGASGRRLSAAGGGGGAVQFTPVKSCVAVRGS